MALTTKWSQRVVTVVAAGLVVTTLGCDDGKKAEAKGDGTILTPYLEIQSKLASDSVDGLPELGAQVVQAAESKKGEPGVDKIVQGAGRVASPDIATARSAFKTMSGGMIENMKAKSDKQAGHTIVHCTMTFKGKGGLWVQKEGTTMNPYEGSMMLNCGDQLKWDAELPKT